MPPASQPRHDTAMTIDNLDIYRSARVVQKQYGAAAMAACRVRMAEFEQAGNAAAVITCRRIIAALEVLERAEPGEGERRH